MKEKTYISTLSNLKSLVRNHKLDKLLMEGLFGIEKENVRVNEKGEMSLTPHDLYLGDKQTHPYITTDFSESQVEMITPPLNSINEAHGFMETIHDIVSENIGDELLWPQSAPPLLPEEDKIPIARYGEQGRDKEIYREKLAEIYGKHRQMLSGIHFNFSFSDKLLKQLVRYQEDNYSEQEIKEEIYLKITRNFMRYRWFLIWLYGQSPISHESLRVKSLKTGENEQLQCQNGLSIRTSCKGYRNIEDYKIDYSSIRNFQNSVEELVKSGCLVEDKELYLPLRIKFEEGKLSHLEVRLLDLNPFEKTGLAKETLYFTHLFLIYCLLRDEKSAFNEAEQDRATKNQDLISCYGMDEEIILNKGDESIRARDWAREILGDISALAQDIQILDNEPYKKAFDLVCEIAMDPSKRRVHSLKSEIKEKGFIDFHLAKAKEYKQDSIDKAYRFHGKEDMELSTQLLLKAAVRGGVSFEILDRAENFVRLQKDEHEEYVMQATRTSLDPYNSVLMMENKVVTKKVLEKANIAVPGGSEYDDAQSAKSDFPFVEGKAIVVKPKSTNFGLGITILKENKDKALYERAVEMAFEQDSSILVEEFIDGKEFRIFIINDKVVGILHRVPANVKGDGVSNIRELIEVKNQDPLRGKGYRTPLEKIAAGEAEEMFLKTQSLNFESIPAKGEVVYLRENSNISTGGDSLDFTDDVHESYKRIAEDAARALKVKITGLDMIIKDHSKEAASGNHSIIEMNFNPAIHIHCFPFVGKNRGLNEKMLDALGF